MPSLLRFVVLAATLTAIAAGSLYALAVFFEPEQREVSKPVPGVKIRK
jgi:hypothetical protein